MLMRAAIEDFRALELLESLTDRGHVCDIIDETAGYTVTFKEYPRSEGYIVRLREQVNREIMELLAKR